MGAFVKPFRMGDVVQGGWEKGDKTIHIITEVAMPQEVGYFEYATTRGAWFPHKRLKLVRECDEASLKEMIADAAEDGAFE
jgi:hypothetical protein